MWACPDGLQEQQGRPPSSVGARFARILLSLSTELLRTLQVGDERQEAAAAVAALEAAAEQLQRQLERQVQAAAEAQAQTEAAKQVR